MSKPQTIFVTVQVILSDPEDWTTANGVTGYDAIKADVKEFVVSNARDALTGTGEIRADVTGW